PQEGLVMAKARAKFPEAFEKYVVSAVETIFRDTGVTLTPKDAAPPEADAIATVIGMSAGDARGSCLIFCNPKVLSLCHPEHPDPKSAGSKDQLNDCCGELANLVMGYLKRMLAGNQIEVRITPPSILDSAEKNYDDFRKRGANCTNSFTGEH